MIDAAAAGLIVLLGILIFFLIVRALLFGPE